MNVSEGSRPFTRYSYGDFLREDRPYDVVFRIWPGTQRVLLWGDPAMAAGFGRNASIAGSEGLEWCEPLSLKGREGTALPGTRDGYADASLTTADDWEKHAYTFRLFGRLLYDPDAAPETWRRQLRSDARTAGGAGRVGARERQPHPAARHERAPPVGVEQLLLAGDLHGHRDRRRRRTRSRPTTTTRRSRSGSAPSVRSIRSSS